MFGHSGLSGTNMAGILQCIRSSEKLWELIKARGVEKNSEYLPGASYTWCNKYVRDLLADLEVPFPQDNWFAHQQIDYISSAAGLAAGWSKCGPREGVIVANEGKPVLATYRNPKTPPAGHSHIALLVPTAELTPYITQAGARNYTYVMLERGFGKLPVTFFWHQ
jgi:hypothetical protein